MQEPRGESGAYMPPVVSVPGVTGYSMHDGHTANASGVRF